MMQIKGIWAEVSIALQGLVLLVLLLLASERTQHLILGLFLFVAGVCVLTATHLWERGRLGVWMDS